jgi:V8-like Glu-specific endopeptidase
MNRTIAEQLMHITIRLECILENGTTSTGTGFFFKFKIDEENFIPVIITNKHVICSSTTGSFVLTISNDNGEPIIGTYEKIEFTNFESQWIKHPDENVDLAVFPLAPFYQDIEKLGKKFFIPFFDEDIILSTIQQQYEALSGIDDITMIGYPNGIWDSTNNMPIIRRGVTATHPMYDYNGLPVFVIDCACFPGSSGSPILIFDQGNSYTNPRTHSFTHNSNRLILLGILYAGLQHVAEGEIQVIDIPLHQVSISLSKIPNNLGFVVKAQKILDFKSILIGKINGENQ